MKSLQDFLNENNVEGLTKEVPISDRLRDENGNLYKAKIKAMTSKEFGELRKSCTRINKKGKPEVDAEKLTNIIVIENTVVPNFKDAESIKKVGCLNAEQYINKVLLPGEITVLNDEILLLSGFNSNMDDLIEEVKN